MIMVSSFFCMRNQRVCSPHGASRGGSFCCLQSFQFSSVPCLPVNPIVDPRDVPNKVKWYLLEALLC